MSYITRYADNAQQAQDIAAFERSQGHLPMVRQIGTRYEIRFSV